MPEALIDELVKIDLFADLPPKHLKSIATHVETRSARDGEEIVREGAYSGDFFVIFSGSAEVSVRSKHRMTVGPGEFFGEVAILGHTQSSTVKALERMELGVIDAKEFFALLESEPKVAVHLAQALILRLEELTVRPAGQLA